MSSWRGSSRFRMMPADDFDERLCTAELKSGAGGQSLLLTYTWEHADDGPQDGVLLVGSAPDGETAVSAAWGDSWHQHPGLMTFEGTSSEGRVELAAEYGGGWGWQIAVATSDHLTLTMSNVIPEEHATADTAAGPYVVMDATLHQESG